MSRRKEELKRIYESLDPPEKYYLMFAVFPARLGQLTKDECKEPMLMAIADLKPHWFKEMRR